MAAHPPGGFLTAPGGNDRSTKGSGVLILGHRVLCYCEVDVTGLNIDNHFIDNKKQRITTMSKVCEITGKKAITGNNVSHSKRRTKRKFNVNVQNRKFYWVEQQQWIKLTVSAAGLRLINRIGLDAALKKAAADGNLKEIKTIVK